MADEPVKPIDPQLLKDVADALKIAKITMMMQKNTVFYTTILFSLKQICTEEIPTAATDGMHLLINPTWFFDLAPHTRIGLLAHEVLHVALDHMHRRGKRDPQMWNIAADYVINNSLKKAGYSLPEGGCVDSKYEGMTTEQVYDIIHGKNKEQQQALLDQFGKMAGDVQYPDPSKSDQVSQDHVTEIILRATTQAKAMGQDPGSVPGEIAIGLERTINPPLPWHIILSNYLTEFDKSDYSFRRPNRRFMPDHYLPTAHSESIANIAVVVDASCSVSQSDFNSFITKISDIQQKLHPKKITVVAFDTAIKSVQELTDDQDPFKELKFEGRGGTRISPVHEWIAEAKPTVVLVLTDGEFSQTEPINKTIPIVWLIHDDPLWKSKYGGRVIHYEL